MPSNNSKYTEEMREQTAQYIIESGKSATGVAEELGIDKNTVCSWVRAYRRKHNMPTYAEEKGIVPNAPPESKDLVLKVKELENKLKEKDKESTIGVIINCIVTQAGATVDNIVRVYNEVETTSDRT